MQSGAFSGEIFSLLFSENLCVCVCVWGVPCVCVSKCVCVCLCVFNSLCLRVCDVGPIMVTVRFSVFRTKINLKINVGCLSLASEINGGNIRLRMTLK